MGPQTHEAEDLSNRLLRQSRESATTWSYISHSLAQPKPSPPSSFIFPERRLLWTAVRQSEILSLNTFFLPWQRFAQQLLHPGAGKAALTTSFIWPGIPCQNFALPLSHWNEQTALASAKITRYYAGSWEHPFFTSHSPAKDGSLVEKKTKSNTPPFSETQRFQCAHPQWGQSKLVWIQDWCWTHTQWVGKLGTLLLSNDLRQSAGCFSWEPMQHRWTHLLEQRSPWCANSLSLPFRVFLSQPI